MVATILRTTLWLTSVVVAGLALVSTCAAGATLTGHVIDVPTGDMLTLMDEGGREHTVRLAGISSPSTHQAFGDKSRQRLAEQVLGKPVRVEWSVRDARGRLLGRVFYKTYPRGVPPNLASYRPATYSDAAMLQLAAGMAWHDEASDQHGAELLRDIYEELQESVCRGGLGLWSAPASVSPAEWRARGLKPVPLPTRRDFGLVNSCVKFNPEPRHGRHSGLSTIEY